MGPTTLRFFAYAQDFEQTYADDDWSRLAQYFQPDAVYEVRNVPFGCRLEGRDTIFRGIKKSLDNFDRRFAERRPEITDPPAESGDSVSVGWAVTYVKPGAPPFVLRGRSTARFGGERIVHLVDEYPDGMADEAARWARAHAPDLDASYV
jgi:hypothetical protein